MKTFAIFTMIILLTGSLALAEEQVQEQQPDRQPLIRRKTTSLVRGLTDRIDDLFGTERRDENRRFSTLRLSGRHTIVKGLPSDSSLGVRLMLKPATFQNWSAQADQWAKRKKDNVRNSLRPRQPETGAVSDSEFVENIEIDQDVPEELGERDPWRFAFQQRFRFDRHNFYEGRLKATKDIESGPFLHHAVGDIRWSVQRKWESVLSVISSYALTELLLFQFSNAFIWRITAREFENSYGPSLAYTLSSSKAISLDFTATVGTPAGRVNNQTISSVYRQHIYEDWIDFSVTPYHSYARSRNFPSETGIIFNVEVIF